MNLSKIRMLSLRSLDAGVLGESGPRKIILGNSIRSLEENFTPAFLQVSNDCNSRGYIQLIQSERFGPLPISALFRTRLRLLRVLLL